MVKRIAIMMAILSGCSTFSDLGEEHPYSSSCAAPCEEVDGVCHCASADMGSDDGGPRPEPERDMYEPGPDPDCQEFVGVEPEFCPEECLDYCFGPTNNPTNNEPSNNNPGAWDLSQLVLVLRHDLDCAPDSVVYVNRLTAGTSTGAELPLRFEESEGAEVTDSFYFGGGEACAGLNLMCGGYLASQFEQVDHAQDADGISLSLLNETEACSDAGDPNAVISMFLCGEGSAYSECRDYEVDLPQGPEAQVFVSYQELEQFFGQR